MESFGEVGVPDFIGLMGGYLDGRITVAEYTKGYFSLMKKNEHFG